MRVENKVFTIALILLLTLFFVQTLLAGQKVDDTPSKKNDIMLQTRTYKDAFSR